ncbi:MAG TPA: hypothetical protein VM753_05645 [Anaeromyxobacter sp.]|jgi:hypothetical protein|nr:hypothetical protein [Anaeromyxobacter sp.]
MFPPRLEDRPKRWPRGQKFTLSPEGGVAEEAYRAAVATARASGRAALDAALAAWAAPLGVQPGDGIVLSELRQARRGIPELSRALEEAGIAPDEVRAAIERLVGAGAVSPVPLASQVGF